MFVGVGASRVRDLFTKAKKLAPAIIFVDEIDAVGRNRGQGMGGGNDEREQTLNQLLVEMDGFDERANVIVIAATNRPDVLDPALLRPGRFDRQIAVDAPDLKGRAAILKVHAEGKPLAEGIELESIARRTPGFAGAELANLLNEAALLATRRGHDKIGEDDLDEAIDRVIAGPQRRTHVMNAEEKRMTAYHEGGHAVAAAALHHSDPVTKVTILPRGRALGYTMVMPTEDKYSVSRNELLDQLVYAMGGRVAEEIVFHDPSTGASNDIQKATDIARKMVMEYGMSSTVGSVRLVPNESDPMTRFGGGGSREYSDELARVIDAEVRDLVEAAHQEAWALMMENRHVLDALSAALLEKETILEKELAEIFKDIVKAPKRELWLSSPHRPVSDLPPVPLPEVKKEEARAGEETTVVQPEVDPMDSLKDRRSLMSDLPKLHIGHYDEEAVVDAIKRLLIAVGEDPNRDGLLDTPDRMGRAYKEMFAGLGEDPADVLNTTFDIRHEELVLVRDISMYSMCEHHLLPFHGVAHIGYIPGPDGLVTGLSKLARLVEGFARRPQVQERLTSQIVDAIMERLNAQGAIVVVEAEHLCMSMRGVKKPGSHTVTSAVRGKLRETATRAEAMSLIMSK